MTIKAAMIQTSEGASFVLDGKPYDCSATHVNYRAVIQAAKNKEWEKIPDLINIQRAIKAFIGGQPQIVVETDYIRYGDQVIHGTIVDRILTMISEGFDPQPMIKFLNNLYLNPVQTAIDELYDFMVKAKLPITEDGYFLAYKRVRADYTSIHDSKFRNDIGTQPAMARSEVDANRHNHCSRGLHFCSFSYLSSFGGARTVIVKINPADVVSIPSDYDSAKGRAWTYFIECEVDQDRDVLSEASVVVKSSVDIPTSSSHATASPTVLGYDAGYRTKRYKETGHINPYDNSSQSAVEWSQWFDIGFEHAKKRLVRVHKAPAKQ